MIYKNLLLSFFLIVFATSAFAGPQKALKKGFIFNDSGKKCWYTQEFQDDVVYFTKKHTQNVGVITFDDLKCMSDSGLGLDVNKMMINNLISKWYSHDDANFKTRVFEMYPTSSLQIKWECIQSETYSMIGILVDYDVANNSIKKVVHGSSIRGCTGK